MKFTNKYLGLVDYAEAYELQLQHHELCKQHNQNYILGLEHPTVVTLGYRAEEHEEVLDANLKRVKVQRGGMATLHSEGQLVIYPIVDLRSLNLGVREYVELILKTTQKVLLEYQIESKLDDKAIGLYTAKGKIAFCGVQVKNGVTLHGISLNVKNDLDLFGKIRSCGVQQAAVDSMSNYANFIALEQVFNKWVRIFYYKNNAF